MGFRFRRTFQILPGVKVNIGKEGVSSVSVGKKGAHVSVGKKGVRQSVGIPGTGLSYSTKVGSNTQETQEADTRASLRCPHCNALTNRGDLVCGACGGSLVPVENVVEEKSIFKKPLFWLWLLCTIAIPPLGVFIALVWCLSRVFKK